VFHSLSSSSLKDGFSVKNLKSMFLEDNKDDFPVFDGLPYPHEDYISPIQHWIEKFCNISCHPWHEFCMGIH
jgi:hypothetical protein